MTSASVRIDRVEIVTAGEIGSAHRARAQGSEDAVGWSGADGRSVIATVAIADGHSDRRCVRSQSGAAFVVAAATSLPADAVAPAAIATALVGDWRRRVDDDLVRNPLTADEGEAIDASTASVRIAYGSTAAVCRITTDAITIVRVGDGDVIAVAADGEARRLAAAVGPLTDVTDSISAPNAVEVARSAEIPAAAAPVLLLLATDGFDNAYPGEQSMLQAASELAVLRRETGQPIDSDLLRDWARKAAEVSGDDATVAVVWIETVGC